MLNQSQKVCVVGQGYVGLPLAKAAVNAGHRVVGLDTDKYKVNQLNNGGSPIEDVTPQDVHRMINDGYAATADVDEVSKLAGGRPDTWVITVPTPLRSGKPDLAFVNKAAYAIAPYIKKGALVVLESTVAPGTTRFEFLHGLRTGRVGQILPGTDFYLAFSPERIDPGNKKYDFVNTPKIVAGYTEACRQAAFDFYNSIMMPMMVEPVASLEVAETAKLLENTFRHVNIALVNELGRHCHELGIDVWDVINAASTKPYGFMKFTPGPGVGGHCLPVDPAYLGDKVKTTTGNDFHFVDLAMRINSSQPQYVVDRIADILNDDMKSVKGRRILVMGYAYKPNTSDARETPAADICDQLREMGAAVFVYDPHVNMSVVDTQRWSDVNVSEFDLVVVLTDHTAFESLYPLVDLAGVPILDTRDVFPPGSKNVIRL